MYILLETQHPVEITLAATCEREAAISAKAHFMIQPNECHKSV